MTRLINRGTSEPGHTAPGRLYVARVLLAGFIAFVEFNRPVLAEGLITSDKLIQKLSVPAVQPRGLVKTTGPDISNSNAASGASMATGSVMLKIRFEYDSSRLSVGSRAQLNELGEALNSQQLASYNFEIAGHTDGAGEREYNKQLSIRRAGAVRDYLSANLGVRQDRLRTVGWGEDRPLVPGDPYHPDNRRVEIINLGR